MRNIERTRATLNRWTVYDGPGSPLVRRGVGHPEIEGWTKTEVVPVSDLRGAVEANAKALAILNKAMGDVNGMDWPNDVRGYIAEAAVALGGR